MFKRDQAIISQYARANPENMARVCQFVILTARNKLVNVPSDMETCEQGEPSEILGVLFGWKFQAYNDVWINRQAHYDYCEHAARVTSDKDLASMIIEHFADQYGYGLVKAGFIAQLIYGVGGCLDTHNLRRLYINETKFKDFKTMKTVKARRRKLLAYVNLCEQVGGAEYLWDSWCEYVAKGQPTTYVGANHVSRLHCEALGL